MSWTYQHFEPKIVYLAKTNSWRCLVRNLPDGDFRSLEGPGNMGHATPNDALDAAVTRVGDLLAARRDALAVEVVRLLAMDPPRLRRALDPPDRATMAGDASPLDAGPLWQAQADDGTWTDPVSSPYKAVKLALRRD